MRNLYFFLCFFLFLQAHAQFNESAPWMLKLKKDPVTAKQAKGNNQAFKFEEIQQSFQNFWSDKDKTAKGAGYKQFKRWEYQWQRFVKEDGYLPTAGDMRNSWDSRLNLSLPSNNQASWSSLEPTTFNYYGYSGVGRVNAIAIDPVNPNTWYVGAPSGGLWKSTDAGANWQTTTDGLFQLGVSGSPLIPPTPILSILLQEMMMLRIVLVMGFSNRLMVDRLGKKPG